MITNLFTGYMVGAGSWGPNHGSFWAANKSRSSGQAPSDILQVVGFSRALPDNYPQVSALVERDSGAAGGQTVVPRATGF